MCECACVLCIPIRDECTRSKRSVGGGVLKPHAHNSFDEIGNINVFNYAKLKKKKKNRPHDRRRKYTGTATTDAYHVTTS